MRLTSSAFAQNRLIPARYTCKGDNINPSLMFKGAPDDAKSLALIVHDPDAPRGDWVHWTLWDIRPDVVEIPEGSAPVGAIEGTTDFGRTGYGGPCPPSGTHRYFFELYALDKELNLPATTTRDELARVMEGHTLAKAELIGLFSKN